MLGCSCWAQNLLIKFYPDNKPYPGLTNWPSNIEAVTYSTNSPGWDANISNSNFVALVSQQTALYKQGESNSLYLAHAAAKASYSSNITALINSYSNLNWAADNFAIATNVTNLRIAVKAVGNVLLKLKPVLTEMYQTQQLHETD